MEIVVIEEEASYERSSEEPSKSFVGELQMRQNLRASGEHFVEMSKYDSSIEISEYHEQKFDSSSCLEEDDEAKGRTHMQESMKKNWVILKSLLFYVAGRDDSDLLFR